MEANKPFFSNILNSLFNLIVRNVALQAIVDNNGEKRHVVALVNQEKTIENSNLEIRGEIPLPYRINAEAVRQTTGSMRADTPLCAVHLQMDGVQERGEVVA